MFLHSMTFDLGEDVHALQEAVHRWAQERVKPMAAEIDRTNEFPNELWREMGDLGLLGVTVEEICATLAVMVVSYIILAMPCFVGRSNKQRQRQQARLWKSRSKVSWSRHCCCNVTLPHNVV